MKRISLFIDIIVSDACLFLAGCGDSGSKKWRLDNVNEKIDTSKMIRISIEELEEIRSNPFALNSEIKSKRFIVSGEIKFISLDGMILISDGDFNFTTVYFNIKYKSDLANFKQGDWITVYGIINSEGDLSSCRLLKEE